MSVITIGDKILKTYTNKNSAVFKSASRLAYNSIKNDGNYGILYDDFNCDKNMISLWKKENDNIQLFYNANRKKH